MVGIVCLLPVIVGVLYITRITVQKRPEILIQYADLVAQTVVIMLRGIDCGNMLALAVLFYKSLFVCYVR